MCHHGSIINEFSFSGMLDVQVITRSIKHQTGVSFGQFLNLCETEAILEWTLICSMTIIIFKIFRGNIRMV